MTFAIEPGTTRFQAVAALRRSFSEAGLDSPALDARILLTEALGIEAIALITQPEAPIDREGASRLSEFAARRLSREPVARILGEREFWGLPFGLSPATLVPRPETETVVRTALKWAGARQGLRIIDLGTGSGCLLVALLSERRDATGLGLDRSFEALRTARLNAERNGVGPRAAFVATDWGAAIQARFDLIVSNPPYIATGDIAGLDPEVRAHDPGSALDGGVDGLSAYRVIFGDMHRLLSPGGRVVVEFGMGQERGIREVAPAAGLEVEAIEPDLQGLPRAALLLRRPRDR